MAALRFRFRVRLRVGIAVMFLGIMLPLTGLMTTVLYRQNSHMAVQMAEHAMDNASAEVVAGMGALLGPMGRVVDMSVVFGKAERDTIRRIEGLRPMVDQMERFPDLYALFFGFAKDGAFYEVIRVPPPDAKIRLRDRKPPANARFALRMIDSIDGEWVDSWIYISEWGKVVGVERAPEVTYDPRKRPWYTAALASRDVATSSLHVFSSIGLPGLTLSKQLATDDGELIAVFAADLSIETLSRSLAGHRVGNNGQVFILDEEQRLLGHPDPSKALVQSGGHVEIVKAEDFSDPILANAVRLRNQGRGDRFRFTDPGSGEEYLAAFSHFPEKFGKDWTIGIIAAERDFVGPLRRGSLLIVVIGVIFLLLAAGGVVAASRLLTRPIRQLTDETERIRNLDLAGDIAVKSAVIEIQTLASALSTMKTALRSFGAYVPKGVLRRIIQSGAGTEVGGERRELTILFTDIKGFSQASEGMVPEDVLHHLSVYLEGMAAAIGQHNGTIDKFIGDAVMALWNAPQLDPEHAFNACSAMLACNAEVERLNAELVANRYPPMPTRFGLHTGVTVVGNVGCNDRMQYTALGAAVNLASRVESLNKHFGTTMLITGAVEELVRGRFALRPLGPVVASGTTIPMPLFELLGALPGQPHAAGGQALERLEIWNAAFALYAQGRWEEAAEGFRDFMDAHPMDVPATLLLERALANAEDPAQAETALHFLGK